MTLPKVAPREAGGMATRAAAAAVCAMALGACAAVADLSNVPSDIVRTWDRAVVVLPSEGGMPVVARMDDGRIARWRKTRPPGRTFPVVLYMHGCDGIGNLAFFRALANAGYAVVAPDSMARRFRPLQCDPKTRTGGYHLFVYDFRLAEISYALERLESIDWIDRGNLFLAGASEGGVATALYRGDAFRARIIAQWTCHGAPVVHGLAAPPETPVLAIVNGGDPWYGARRTSGQRGDCGAFMAGHLLSRSIVLDDSATHDVFADPANVKAMLDFLDGARRR